MSAAEPTLFDGLLPDPLGHHTKYLNRDMVQLAGLDMKRGRILLAEPGMGKTNEIHLDVGRLRSGGDTVEEIDLGTHSDSTELRDDIRERVDRWERATDRTDRDLTFAFDALDEPLALGLPALGDTIARALDRVPPERLRVLVACRTSLWQKSFEDAMRVWWGDDGVAAVHLMPLTRRDIELAAASEGLDPEAFVSDVIDRGAGVLAARPVTLRLLLAAAKEGALPTTRTEIYRQGTAALARERADSRRTERRIDGPPSARVLAAAQRLAAVTLLSGRPHVTRRLGDPDRHAVALEEVPTDDATIVDLEAAYDSALFASDGTRRRWSHRSIEEYLAAEELARLGLPTVKNVLTLPDNPSRIVPQLADTVGWVAALSPTVFDWVLGARPELLITPDLATQPEQVRARVAQAVILRLQAGEPLNAGARYSWLAHRTLADQLRSMLDDGEPAWRRRSAIHLLAATGADGCDDELVGIVEAVASAGTTATGDLVHLADTSATALRRSANSDIHRRLFGVLANRAAPASTRATIIRTMFPTQISAAEVTAAVEPDQRFAHGSLTRSVLYAFGDAVDAQGVSAAELLQWFEAAREANLHDDATSRLATRAVLATVAEGEIGGREWNLATGLARMLLRARRFDDTWEEALSGMNDDRRRVFARDVMAGRRDDGTAHDLLHLGGVRDEDLEYWVDEVAAGRTGSGTDGGLSAPGVIDAIVSSGDPTVIQEQAARAAARHADLAEWLGELTSDAAFEERARRRAEFEASRAAQDEQRRVWDFDPARLATSLDGGDFGAVLAELQRHAPRTEMSLPGAGPAAAWHALTHDERAMVADAAQAYLAAGPPQTAPPAVPAEQPHTTDEDVPEQEQEQEQADERQGTSLHECAAAAADAQAILHAYEAARLDAIPDKTWLAWLPLLLGASVGLGAARTAAAAAERADHDATVLALLRQMAAEAARGYVSTKYALGVIRDDLIGATAIELVSDDAHPYAVAGLLEIAVEYGSAEHAAKKAAQLVATCPALPTTTTHDLDNPDVAAWRRAIAAIAGTVRTGVASDLFDDTIGLFRQQSEAFVAVAQTTRTTTRTAFAGLRNDQLAELYIWAREQFPARDIQPGVIVSNDPVQDTIDDILSTVRERGDLDAADTLQGLAERYDNVYLAQEAVQIRDRHLAETAVRLAPADVTQVLDAPDKRIVTTQTQLVQLLLDILDDIEEDLASDRALRAQVWHRQADGTWMPMEELEFATWLKAELQRRAQERIVLLRETRINPRLGDEAADDPDLLAVVVASTGTLYAPVEVKGNWHRDVVRDLTEQLINRYLAGPAGREGIYVVGYYSSEMWTAADRSRRAAARRHSLKDLAETLEADAAKALDGITAHIRVMDLSLNPGDVASRDVDTVGDNTT